MDKLKYSQLLRLGRQKVTPIKGQWFRTGLTPGEVSGACVIGMIAVAKAGSLNLLECQSTLNQLTTEMSVDSETFVTHLVELYETHKKSPEEVADWLEERGK